MTLPHKHHKLRNAIGVIALSALTAGVGYEIGSRLLRNDTGIANVDPKSYKYEYLNNVVHSGAKRYAIDFGLIGLLSGCCVAK